MLLNRPKNIDVIKLAAEEYINNNYIIVNANNYNIEGELSFENVDGVCIVNCNSSVYVKNKKIEKLTEGFVWGEVEGRFDCSSCFNLKSLEDAPKEVGEYFNCSHCKNLKTLKGSPKEVGGDFNCSNCENLKSLEGSPKNVGGGFYCCNCNRLKSLEGSPKNVGGNFSCYHCLKLKSLEGIPEEVMEIYCDPRFKNKKSRKV